MRRNGLLIAIGLLLTVLAVAAIACDDEEEGVAGTAAATETTEATAEETPQATAAGTQTPEGGAPPAATVLVSEHPQLGRILTDAEGRTLYTFSEDAPNTSTCQTSPCPQTFPPLIIESGTPVAGEGVPGQLGVITRQDGSRQVSYDGKALHYFLNDRAPGEANAQGVGGRWFVVQVSQ